MYHSISEVTSKDFAAFVVPPRVFADQVAYLVTNGYSTLTLFDLVRLRKSGQFSPPRSVVLTFDDAYADFAKDALPVLRRYGCTASLYVTTGAVGRTNFWVKGDAPRRILTWDELREVAKAGVEIGAHSVTHRALDALSEHDLRQELAEPKIELEDKLSQEVMTVAYPFGFESKRVRAAAAVSGYAAGCAVGYRASNHDEDLFGLSRLIVVPGLDMPSFSRLLEPRSTQWVRRARSLAWRAVRRVTTTH